MLTPDPDVTPAPRPRRRWWRLAAIVVGVCVLAVVLVVGALHLPFARRMVLDRVVGALAEQGIRLSASGLSYNLLTLRVEIDGGELSAAGATPPFLSFDRATVDLPWSLITSGELGAESVELIRGRVSLVRDANGQWNLPPGSEEEGAPLEGPIRVGRLLVEDLDVAYEDVPAATSVGVRGLTLDMRAVAPGPLQGTLAMRQPATITLGDQSTTIDSLSGSLAFDGTTVDLSAFDLRAPEGTVGLEGSIDALGSDPTIDLRYRIRVDAQRSASWAALTPAPTGFVLAEGTVTGERDAPTVTTVVGSEELAWGAVGAIGLDGRTAVAGNEVAIDAFRVDAAGGNLTATGRLSLAADGTSTVGAEWTNLDLTRLLSAVPDLALRPGARSNGTLAWAWQGSEVVRGRGSVETRQRATAARSGVLPIDGPVAVRVDDGRWTLSAAPVVAGTVATRLSAAGQLNDDATDSTLGGTLSVEVADLAAAVGALTDAGVVADLGPSAPSRGNATVALTLGGSLTSPRATGTIDGYDVVVADTGPLTLATRLDASPRVVELQDLRVLIGTNRLAGNVSVGLEANTLAGELRADLPDLSRVAAALPEAWRPEGSAAADVTIAGALDNPTADVIVRTRTVAVAGQTIDSLTTNVRVADRAATVDSLVLTQRDGRLEATGRYSFDGGQYAFTASGTGLVVTPIVTAVADGADPDAEAGVLPLSARLDLELSGEGTVDAPQAAGRLSFASVDWAGYQMGAVTADLALRDGQGSLAAAVPSVNGSIEVATDLESGRLTATVDLADAELAALARATGPAGAPADPDATASADGSAEALPLVTGTMNLRATASGSTDDLAAIDIKVELGLTDASVNGVPVRVERTARLHHAAGAVEAEDLEVYIGDARLVGRGRLGADTAPDDQLTIDLTGSLDDFAPLLALAPGLEGVTLAGGVALHVGASGPLDRPDLSAYVTVTDGQVASADLPPATGLTLAATYSAGIVNLSRVAGRWQGADLLATGYVPLTILGEALPETYRATLPPALGPARLEVVVASLTAEALRPFLSADAASQISGRIDAAALVEATALDLDAVTAEVRLDRAAVELARVPLAQTQPTRLRLANRRLDVVDWNWTGTGNAFGVRGHVLLGENATTLDLGVTGSLDLRMFSAFAPGLATAGRADLDINARGTAAEPVVEGQLALSNASVIVREPRLALTDLTGTARLTPNRVTIDGLTGNANGGTVVVTGDLDYTDFALADGALTVTGRGLALEAVDGLRTELNLDLTLTMAPEHQALGGRVTIVRGDYRQPLRLTEQLFSTLEVETGGPAAGTGGGMADTLQLDIAVVSAQDIAVDNNYGQFEVGANLRITGTPSFPVLGGRLALREDGEIYLGGQTYTIQRGTVDFTSGTRIEPNFNVSLETRVRTNDITLDLTGTPDALEVGLRSPGISQEDVISLLLTGQLAADSGTAYSEVARGQLLMLLSGELLSTAGRAVGLDSVQVSRGLGGAASSFDLLATDSDPEARLTLAKNLSREVELIVSQSLRNTGDITWIAIYRPVRRIEIRAATDDQSRETYEFRHELQLGAGATADTGPTRAPDPEVAAVRIEGTPGVPNAEILSRLRLTVGDRFDYFTWQRDRDRLAAFYDDRGQFEARIDARREPAGAGSTSLVYDIDPGPRTVLRVEGYTLPSGVVEDIEAAWAESVYDGFLRDDAVQLARRDLIRNRYLRSTVDATVETSTDGGTKTLTVAITPGPRSETRRIEFAGNQAVSAGDLRAVLESGTQNVSLWMEPEAIETTLSAFYRSRGHLLAEVSVGQPQFDNGAAVLPVQIHEGPEFRIGTIGVSGAAFRTADAVREVTGLKSGAPYRPADIEPARRRVEVDYLGAGYNDVSVSTIVGVDEERAVADVVFAVAEGPQQILRDVQVRNDGITSSGTIDRTLSLDTGEPLDMTAIYTAQKRLYDTSVFQRVDINVEPIEGAEEAVGKQAVRAVVDLEETPRYRFRYGFRVSDFPGPAEDTHDVRPALVADLLNRNLFGKAIAAGVAGQLEADRRLARTFLSLPSLFTLPITSTFYVTRSRETIGEGSEDIKPYIDDELDFTFEQRVRPVRTMSVTWGYTLSKEHIFEVEPDPLFPLDDRQNVARLTGTFAWDQRDDPSNATRGWFTSSSFEFGPKALGSDLRYIRLLNQQYYFRRVGERVVLASALRIGAGRGFGGQELLPSERFYTGGGTSIRGFGEEAVGGRDIFGFARGGAGLVQFNQEARFPIFGWVHGVTFFDTGNVFQRAGDMTFRSLERGAGFGLRIFSPFAILRVDYGVPLTNRDNERPRWYFGIGQTF